MFSQKFWGQLHEVIMWCKLIRFPGKFGYLRVINNTSVFMSINLHIKKGVYPRSAHTNCISKATIFGHGVTSNF